MKCNVIADLQATLLLLLVALAASAQKPTSWADSSPHRVQFLPVEENVRLEVLDWGGSGPSLVLLTGSGNTAHVFDDFAPGLTGRCHVYGITRRRYSASSRPESGYTSERLGDDVLAMLDALHLTAPVLAGHSMGGQEMTALASAHPHRIAGLVYMDATADPTADWKPYEEAHRKLPAAMTPRPPSTDDLKSFQAFRDWRMRTQGITFPESELRNCFAAGPDGTVGRYGTPTSVRDAIHAGARKPDFSRVRVPVLALVTLPMPLEGQLKRYTPQNAEERASIEHAYAVDLDFAKKTIADVRSGVPDARIVELAGAHHYVFLSNEADVLREVRAFLAHVK
jgi:pimeloyl-ACP methyl ester carboxylesterase